MGRKTISFGNNDTELFNFCVKNSEAKGKKFAAFVKEVLREKMEQESLEKLIERKIEEYLSKKNIKMEEKSPEAPAYKEEDKNALLSFMKKE